MCWLRALLVAMTLVLTLSASAATLAEVERLVKKRDPRALAQAQSLVEAQDASAQAWILLARAQLQKGEAEDAVGSAEKAVELAPEDAQAHFWLGNALGMRIGQVNMLRKMGMAPDLRDAFEAAVRLDPSLLDARAALIQFYLQAPSAMGGGIEKAKAQVAEIARRNAVRGHLAQATVDRYEEDTDAMNRSIDAAVAAIPSLPTDDAQSRLSLVLSLVALERFDQARDVLAAWVAVQPAVATPHYQLGRLAAMSDRYLEEGVAALKRYLDGGLTRAENDPKDTNAWWRLGQIHVKQGDPVAARRAFETALRLDPNNAEAKKDLAAL